MYPEAKLVAYTKGVNGEEPSELLAQAFSQCYQKKANLDVVLRHMKHSSVLEHVSFTYQITCTRVAWEQLVRHRIASYTAQSHRYTDIEPGDCLIYIPQEIYDLGQDAIEEWSDDMIRTWSTYKKWRDKGVTKQTARYQAPKGIAIRARVTFNLRSLINMLTLRTEKHAQEEIQKLARAMWKELQGVLPAVLYLHIQEKFFPWAK